MGGETELLVLVVAWSDAQLGARSPRSGAIWRLPSEHIYMETNTIILHDS